MVTRDWAAVASMEISDQKTLMYQSGGQLHSIVTSLSQFVGLVAKNLSSLVTVNECSNLIYSRTTTTSSTTTKNTGQNFLRVCLFHLVRRFHAQW